eukprot:8572608-Alexandrium_andersonii.AAC.1
MARLCEIAQSFLWQKAKDLVALAGAAPVPCHIAADGTPLSAKRRVKATVGPNTSVQRQGRATEEFL